MYATGGTCTGEQPVRYLSAVTNRHIQLAKTVVYASNLLFKNAS